MLNPDKNRGAAGAGENKPAAYDLHVHTCWSYDATSQPELYFRRARELGLRYIAVTEHNNVDSFPEIHEFSRLYPDIGVIRAAEFTVTTSLGAADFLCYNLPPVPEGALAGVMEKYRGWQKDAGEAVVSAMRISGFEYSVRDQEELLRSYRPERVFLSQGATHAKGSLQREYFMKKGFMRDAGEYKELMAGVVMPPCPPAEEVIPAVKEAGGLVVIAHPAGYFREKDLRRMDIFREECMLDGIECAHRKVDPELTGFYRWYCERHGLVSTGGSDSHHPGDVFTEPGSWGYTPFRRFACHIGEESWLDEFIERHR